MPIHDWTRIPSGLFHHFHQSWTIRITDALNGGLLPDGVSALVEQRAGVKEPDVLAIESWRGGTSLTGGGASNVAVEPVTTKIVRRSESANYADLANRIVVRHHLGRIVAIIEIVSPGNKDGRVALRNFVTKTAAFISDGIHVLVVDLFPPSPRDPSGIHKEIWSEFQEDEFNFPEGKDRILVAYDASIERVAYIEPVTVGDVLPDMPLFLAEMTYVKVPLENTYCATWVALPKEFRNALETGRMPTTEST